MKLPKFHDRKSLVVGAISGLSIWLWGIMDMLFPNPYWWMIPMVMGGVLCVHCLDMIKYYKRHRIVKIEKTDTYRVITKE